MPDVFIANAIRSPIGRRGGTLSTVHPVDLAARVMRELFTRTPVDPALVGDVFVGCVGQIGAQSGNIARTAWLAAGLPEHVPGTTIDRQCGSSQQAIHFAAHCVAAGVYDLVVAGGIESMSVVPIGSAGDAGYGYGEPFEAEGWRARFGDTEITQFMGAQRIAERWGITREEMEEFALASHRDAATARSEGRFQAEICPMFGLHDDEGIRPDTSTEKMATLPPLWQGSRLTAAVSSQISDGAGMLLIASERAIERTGIDPLASFRAFAAVGSDPVLMLSGPIPATRMVLDRAGMSVDDIDLFEVNEAFAPVPLAWARDLDADLGRTNVNGGAIALGHPLGASGARLIATLVHELARTGKRYGLQTMCEGGGMANAVVVERC